MSASEKAARAWLTEARVTVGMFDNDVQRVERLVPSLATLLATAEFTARAEGHRAGMLRAAEIAERVVPRAHTYASENASIYIAQDNTMQRIAAAIRAAAAEGHNGQQPD